MVGPQYLRVQTKNPDTPHRLRVPRTGSAFLREAVIADLQRRCKRNLPEQIRIATVYYKPSRNRSSLTPDYYVRSTDQWLVFPHEVQGLTREEILKHKPVDESLFNARSAPK